jgi:hypothetical protein
MPTFVEEGTPTYAVSVNDGYDGWNDTAIQLVQNGSFELAVIDAAAQAFFAVLAADLATRGQYSIVASKKTRPAVATDDWTYTA